MPLFGKRNVAGAVWFVLGIGCAAILMKTSSAPAVIAPQGPAAAQQQLNPQELATERYQVAMQGYKIAMSGHQPSDAPGPDVIDWMRRRVRARLDMPEPKNDRIAFLKEYVEMLKAQEAFEERMVKSRLSGSENLLRAQFDRIEGEMVLQQAELKP